MVFLFQVLFLATTQSMVCEGPKWKQEDLGEARSLESLEKCMFLETRPHLRLLIWPASFQRSRHSHHCCISPCGSPRNPTKGPQGFQTLPLVAQGQSLVLFMPAEFSFSHPLSHRPAFPCSREMCDMMGLVWRNRRMEPLGFSPASTPSRLAPYRPSQGSVRKSFGS